MRIGILEKVAMPIGEQYNMEATYKELHCKQ